MPLATVSRKVSGLEAHLKTKLLTRTTRRLSLTDAGRSYVAACKRILEEVGEAERAAGGEYSAPKGDIVMTAPIVFGRLHVLPVVSDFLNAYPEINVRMVLADHLLLLWKITSISPCGLQSFPTAVWSQSGSASYVGWSAPVRPILRPTAARWCHKTSPGTIV